jgi:hypothetical protein
VRVCDVLRANSQLKTSPQDILRQNFGKLGIIFLLHLEDFYLSSEIEQATTVISASDYISWKFKSSSIFI